MKYEVYRKTTFDRKLLGRVKTKEAAWDIIALDQKKADISDGIGVSWSIQQVTPDQEPSTESDPQSQS